MKTQKPTSRGRRIVGDVLLLSAGLLPADVLVVMLHKIHAVVRKAEYREILIYQLVLCAVLLFFALDVRFRLFTRSRRAVLRGAGWAARAGVAFAALVIVFFGGKVVAGSVMDTADRAERAIVLGLALENGKPTEDLLARLDTAQAYLERYPEARLILTGGNADGSGPTEAAVMRDILAQRGVAEERLILEDRAESTKENFRNTAQIVDHREPVVLISSDYHMDRAVQTAKSAGFTQVLRLPAPSSRLGYGANVLCEIILEWNELTLKR